MSTALQEQVLLGGDLSKLTPAERLSVYKATCETLGLNPLTKPFQYITLNGKLTLYASKDCTEQLRNIRGVSVSIVSREVTEGIYVVTARATLASGRTDESIGAVTIDKLTGDARANAVMKAETKAKRRVTLSICGLGMLDETEIETIPGATPAAHAEAWTADKVISFVTNKLAEPRTPDELQKLSVWLEDKRALFQDEQEYNVWESMMSDVTMRIDEPIRGAKK